MKTWFIPCQLFQRGLGYAPSIADLVIQSAIRVNAVPEVTPGYRADSLHT